IEGAEKPFLIIEVRDGQSAKNLQDKLHRWAHYCEGRIRIICIVEVIADTENQYRIVFSVLKVRKRPKPTPENPHYFGIDLEYTVDHEDISSTQNPKSFTISASEVCQETWQQDASTRNDPNVTIQLSLLYATALDVVRVKIEQMRTAAEAKLKPKQWNNNPEKVHTPQSSTSSSKTWSSGDEPDDPTDGDYTP
ncbi:MAG: hypothetical protein Q9170_007937, partial [Blastenia crenularia]